MYDDERQEGLGGGIIAVLVIELIFGVFSLLGAVMSIFMKDTLNSQFATMGFDNLVISTPQMIITIISVIILIIGAIFIFNKKKLGLMLYGIYIAINVISPIIFVGFSIFSIVSSLILPAILFSLASKRKYLFE